jgi:hypothetical protein
MSREVQLSPNSFKRAAEHSLPELIANLSYGSAWMDLIESLDDPRRNNSPYYGPATQFIVDCFLNIAEFNPQLAESNSTPLERYGASHYVIRNYIGHYVVGANGILAKVYGATDVATTRAHRNRSRFIHRDIEHILLGAMVPFDDMARVCGGAMLMLDASSEVPESEIAETVIRSKQLQIIGGIDGTKTPELTNALGQNYIEPEYFEFDDAQNVRFSSEAMEVITPLLSRVGCPTAKITRGERSLFSVYWKKIGQYLLENVDFSTMQDQLKARNQNTTQSSPINQISAGVAPTHSDSFAQKVTHPKASKRYTPPKKLR